MSPLRRTLLMEVLRALDDPMLAGAYVMGGAGMGKTMLGQAVEAAAAADFDVTWLMGQQLLGNEPFAAIALLLPPANPAGLPEASAMNVVQMLFERVQESAAAQAKRPLLIVDNAQWLDAHSCAVLEQLAVSGAVKLLLLCRPGNSPVAQSELLTDDTMLAQLGLEILTTAEVLAASEEKLGGKVVPGAAAVFAALSGGHPLFLQAILAAAVEQQAFVMHGSVWALAASPAESHPNVSDIAIDLFNECTSGEQGILEAVALAEPLSEILLHRMFPGNEYETLFESNILCLVRGPAATVQFTAPVFGQSLRHRTPIGRSIEIRRRVLEARALAPLSSTTLMRHIGWSLDCGEAVPQRSLLHAAKVANFSNEPRLALRLGAAVTDVRYSFEARLESVLACIKLGLLSQGRDLLEVLAAEAGTQFECDCVGTLAVMMAASQGYPKQELEQVARQWRQAYVALGLERCAGAELVEALSVVKAGHFLPNPMRKGLMEIGNSADHVGLSFAAHALLARSEVLKGDHPAAERDFTRAQQLIRKHPGWLGLFRHVLTGQHMLFLATSGSPQRALELLDASRTDPGDHTSTEFHGLTELVKALAQRGNGNLAAATASFDVAIAALGEADPVRVLPFALASAAYAQHLLGNHEKAAKLASEFDAATIDDSGPMWLVSKACLVAAGAPGGPGEETFAKLYALAEEARTLGAASLELLVHDVLLRAGCTSHLQRMVEIDVVAAGPAIPMLKALVQGLLAEDANELEHVAVMAGAGENKLLAAEALSHALRLHIQQGDRDGRARVLAQFRGMQFPFQAMGSVAVAQLAATAELTSREKEIAALVHNRFSNRDIAEKFTLSQRTIEGHLYKIYSKLGVGSRDELYEPWLPELLSTPGK